MRPLMYGYHKNEYNEKSSYINEDRNLIKHDEIEKNEHKITQTKYQKREYKLF